MKSTPHFDLGLVWFRRDLRPDDHSALSAALERCARVHCVFVFDIDILCTLPRVDRRVEFIRASVTELDAALRAAAQDARTGLLVAHGKASSIIPEMARALGVQAVFANADYEPDALARDDLVRKTLELQGQHWFTSKDHVILGPSEVLTQAGAPYGVFTPYKKRWLASLNADHLRARDCAAVGSKLAHRPAQWSRPVPQLEELGFAASTPSELPLRPGSRAAQDQLQQFLTRMEDYHRTRDYPAVLGPSYLGVHLRFGTISVRKPARLAWERMQAGSEGAATWLAELIWRDFYSAILAHFPHVVTSSFKPSYDAIAWESAGVAQAHFDAWCEGRTGYPLVDAAMLQLNSTGYMHNRLRMVAGSFLVKDLGVDWRWGERYFARQLNDFELASNNGGWQWVSSSGCDAQPYFRIFNPVSQSLKFDAQGRFIRFYLPQLAALPDVHLHAPWTATPETLALAQVRLGDNYPLPLVSHSAARARTLLRYGVIKPAREPVELS